jgi:hypothetical protein
MYGPHFMGSIDNYPFDIFAQPVLPGTSARGW